MAGVIQEGKEKTKVSIADDLQRHTEEMVSLQQEAEAELGFGAHSKL